MQVGAKTDSGNRTVSIDSETIRELRKLAKRNKAKKLETGPILFQDYGLVISTTVGTPLTPRNLMRTFYRLIEKADVKKIDFTIYVILMSRCFSRPM